MEIILVDNGSTDREVLEFYRELTIARAAKIVPFPREFNYSEACNVGARHASGQVLLFLNNDVSVIDSGWLMEMVRFAVRPGVGCVGTKLLFPDGIVQHAGVIIGLHMCGLLYNRTNSNHWDEFGSPDMYRNVLAIMGACQMVPRAAFEAVGGFDERYRISNSDVALCLRLHKEGLRTVFTPHAALFHHEGLTRGKTNPLEDLELTALDIQEMRIAEDPYFHPAISPHHATPLLRLQPDPSPREFLVNQVRQLSRTPVSESAVAIFDEKQVRNLLGADDPCFPCWSSTDTVHSETDAARLALHLLRTSPQPPGAISQGAFRRRSGLLLPMAL